jgi:hypothetical protein
MKLDQIAFYAATPALADEIKSQFGLTNAKWVLDTVTARSIVAGNDHDAENVAELQFNYDLGIEFEILRYISGPHWHIRRNPNFDKSRAFLSHAGIHLDDNEDFPLPDLRGWSLVQETFTISHTSEYLTQPGSPGFGRKYHYRIFEVSPGSYIKYIKRINPSK